MLWRALVLDQSPRENDQPKKWYATGRLLVVTSWKFRYGSGIDLRRPKDSYVKIYDLVFPMCPGGSRVVWYQVSLSVLLPFICTMRESILGTKYQTETQYTVESTDGCDGLNSRE